jgi:hypothetical protein
VLVDVTALLTSANVEIVAEAFSLPAGMPRTVVVAAATPTAEQQAFQALLDGATGTAGFATGTGTTGTTDPVIAPGPGDPAASSVASTTRLPVSRLVTLRGMPLLEQLALLTPGQLTSFAAQHGDVLQRLAAHPPAASDVGAWWGGISAAKQSAFVKAAPGVIGNLEGVPYRVRDGANRILLSQAESALRARLHDGAGRAVSDELTRRLHMLEQVRLSLAPGPSRHGRELIGLDPSGDGTAVIVIGDPTTADYVGYLIPGMFSSVDTQIVKFAESADQIATDQQHWLDELGGGKTAAVVAWIGYHTPSLANVASLDLARQAEGALTASVDGLRAVRGHDEPFISLMAHSYGSTAALLALQRGGGMSVDALAIVGSPGSPAQDVGQLDVANGNVWVGAAAWDPVPETGLFGSQPTAASYGAYRFGVGGVRDPESGALLSAAVSHNDYFVPGTESLRNIELIGIDRGDLVLAPNGTLALSGKQPATKY